jgi:hypothetical protein
LHDCFFEFHCLADYGDGICGGFSNFVAEIGDFADEGEECGRAAHERVDFGGCIGQVEG